MSFICEPPAAPSLAAWSACSFPSVPTWALIHARVRCLTSIAKVSIYSSVVRTDWDVSLGLFKALIAACESDNILIYLMFSSFRLARVAQWLFNLEISVLV